MRIDEAERISARLSDQEKAAVLSLVELAKQYPHSRLVVLVHGAAQCEVLERDLEDRPRSRVGVLSLGKLSRDLLIEYGLIEQNRDVNAAACIAVARELTVVRADTSKKILTPVFSEKNPDAEAFAAELARKYKGKRKGPSETEIGLEFFGLPDTEEGRKFVQAKLKAIRRAKVRAEKRTGADS